MVSLLRAADPVENRVPADDGYHRVTLGVGVVGAILTVVPGPFAATVEWLLPGRAQISSRGRSYPPFWEISEELVRNTGIALLLSAIVTALVTRLDMPSQTKRFDRAVTVVIVAGTSLWYGWLAYPHNAFPSNARFHWVDYLTFNDDYFFYAAARLPHMLFYEVPHVWQAINAGLVAWLCYLVGVQLGLARRLANLLALAPAISANLLQFSSTAEDVLMNVLLALLVIYASLLRRPLVFGLALALAVTGRPPFILFVAAAVLAEIVPALGRRDARSIDWRYIVRFSMWSGVFIAFSQVVFELFGDRYFFVNGRVVDTGPLDLATPVEVEGFTISAFSGTYLGHAVWMIPIVLIVGALGAVVTASRKHPAVTRTIWFCVLCAASILFVHEYRPQTAYAQRYLTYAVPFVLVAAWAVLAPSHAPRLRWERFGMTAPGQVLVAASLTFGLMTLPVDPIGERATRNERPEFELLEIRYALRELATDRCVYFGDGAKSSRNFMSYVLKSEVWPIRRIGDTPDASFAPDSLVVRRKDSAPAHQPLIETETYTVYVVPGDSSGATRSCSDSAPEPRGSSRREGDGASPEDGSANDRPSGRDGPGLLRPEPDDEAT